MTLLAGAILVAGLPFRAMSEEPAPAATDRSTDDDTAAAPAAATLPDAGAAGLSPRQALVRSALIPGWGQVSGGHQVKGALFGAAAASLTAYAIVGQRDLNRISDRIAQEKTSPALSSTQVDSLNRLVQNAAGARNTRLLYIALTFTSAALDAYVDAHLAGFGDEADLTVALCVPAIRGPAAGKGRPGLGCVLRF